LEIAHKGGCRRGRVREAERRGYKGRGVEAAQGRERATRSRARLTPARRRRSHALSLCVAGSIRADGGALGRVGDLALSHVCALGRAPHGRTTANRRKLRKLARLARTYAAVTHRRRSARHTPPDRLWAARAHGSPYRDRHI
jgi:hypothetical protein